MNAEPIVTRALLVLEKNTGIVSGGGIGESSSQMVKHFGESIRLTKKYATQEYFTCFKNRPSLSQLNLLLNDFKAKQSHIYNSRLLIISEYINQNIAQFLKEKECNFIDSVGNAYLNFDSVFIYITGNKAPKLAAASKPSRAFQSTGLKLIFNLLCHPNNILCKNYRDLSALTGVSIGSIGWVLNDLSSGGYLSTIEGGKRRWLDKQGLIQRWVVAYAETLRPKLVRGYYQPLKNNWYESVDIAACGALWGGEVAADELTHYLKSTNVTIYTDQELGKLVLMNGLKQVQDKKLGSVEIIQKFWTFESNENAVLTPPLIIYADLISSGDSRNLEVANLIYDRYLNVAD